jgi:hypothetical protein
MITNEIGMNAGKIWNLLNELGAHSVKKLKKKLKLAENDFYMAIGWLVREGKVFHFENDGVLKICLKEYCGGKIV